MKYAIGALCMAMLVMPKLSLGIERDEVLAHIQINTWTIANADACGLRSEALKLRQATMELFAIKLPEEVHKYGVLSRAIDANSDREKILLGKVDPSDPLCVTTKQSLDSRLKVTDKLIVSDY